MTFVLAILVAAALDAKATDLRDERACRPYFGSACSEAIGRWLPRIPVAVNASRPRAATRVRDAIVDPGNPNAAEGPLFQRVVDGTSFVYGSAGPPRGHVAYDPVHRIALYDEGCCSWHHTVLAAGVAEPPKRVSERPLTAIRTATGIRLGDNSGRVRAIYGAAIVSAVAGRPSETVLRYARPLSMPNTSPCEAITSFLFRDDALTAIDLTNAC